MEQLVYCVKTLEWDEQDRCESDKLEQDKLLWDNLWQMDGGRTSSTETGCRQTTHSGQLSGNNISMLFF